MDKIGNMLDELEKLMFNDRKISQLENQLLGELELLYGKENPLYTNIFNLTQEGFWRPERGDPRGSASCRNMYQKEYKKHILTYRNLLSTIIECKH